MRSVALIALSSVFLITACQQEQAAPADAGEASLPAEQAPAPVDVAQQQAAPEEVFEDGETQLVADCNPTIPAAVSLTITGNPGDAFKVTKTCAGQQVASCMAQIPAGGNQASCNDGPHPQPAGQSNCVLGVGNGNTPAAKARTWGCG